MTKDEFVKLLDAYKMRCEAVEYASGQLDGLRDKMDHTSNHDDKEAYESGIERMKETIERNRQIRDGIRTKIIDSFKGEKIDDSE